mmetsp:Transcript_15198/g.40153  ORF Transcript_15198/g.40153 Transcript_15198/m.40153 type:complete len:299 (+) Transcript_15198:701-1597(+)
MFSPSTIIAPNACPALPVRFTFTAPLKSRSPYLLAILPPKNAPKLRSVLMISLSIVTSPCESMALCACFSSSSSSIGPLSCGMETLLSLLRCSISPLDGRVVRYERSRACVFVGCFFVLSQSRRPMSSSSERTPSAAISWRTSSPTNSMKFATCSGVPGNRARSSSRCDATPTGQLLVWHTRAIIHPAATIATVPNPYSSAPNAAIISTSRPLRRPPSARSVTRSRSPFSTSVLCVSATPISVGPPQCLMLLTGDAPVPPSWPLIWITSAFAFATPEATVPMPTSATSFTLTFACLLM